MNNKVKVVRTNQWIFNIIWIPHFEATQVPNIKKTWKTQKTFPRHLDDMAESFLMSAFRNGSLRTMKAIFFFGWSFRMFGDVPRSDPSKFSERFVYERPWKGFWKI